MVLFGLCVAGTLAGSQLACRALVRVALPLFGEEISPRFCFAQEALIVDFDDVEVVEFGVIHLGQRPYPERLQQLAERSVDWLICGSFPRERLEDAKRLGIQISCGATGLVPSGSELAAFLAARQREPMLLADVEREP